MRKALPIHGKISKEAKECMQECVSEFISLITSQAAEKCSIEKRKTLNGEDILFSLHSLGFENYAETLKIYLAKYRVYELTEAEARRKKYLARKEKLSKAKLFEKQKKRKLSYESDRINSNSNNDTGNGNDNENGNYNDNDDDNDDDNDNDNENEINYKSLKRSESEQSDEFEKLELETGISVTSSNNSNENEIYSENHQSGSDVGNNDDAQLDYSSDGINNSATDGLNYWSI